jgi:hypothetical protein
MTHLLIVICHSEGMLALVVREVFVTAAAVEAILSTSQHHVVVDHSCEHCPAPSIATVKCTHPSIMSLWYISMHLI